MALALAVLISLVASQAAWAQTTHTWTGTSSGAWDNSANWNTSTVPETNAGNLCFGSSNTTYYLTCPTNVSGIDSVQFNSPTDRNFGISGTGSWTFNDGGVLEATTATQYSQKVEIDIYGGSALTLRTSDNALLQVGLGHGNNTVAMPTGTSSTLVLDSGTGSLINMNSAISGNASLTVNGSGWVSLNRVNTYTGDTTIQGGKLSLSGAIPSTTTVSITSGGRLACHANQTIASLSGDAGTTLDVNAGTTLTINNASDCSFSGLVNGVGTLAKDGTGTLTLGGMMYADAIVHSGTLILDGQMNSNAVTVNSGSFVVHGRLLNTAATVNGGTMVVSGSLPKSLGSLSSAEGSTGTVTLDGAMLSINTPSDCSYHGAVNGSGQLYKSGTGSLTIHGQVSDVTVYVSSGTLTNDTNSTNDTDGLNNVAVTLNPSGTLNLNSDHTSTLTSLIGTGTVNVNNGTVCLNNSNNSTFAGTWNGNNHSLIKNGTGTLTLSGTVSGIALQINAGKVVFSGSDKTINSLSGSGNVDVGSSSLTVNQSINSTFSGALTGGTLTKGGTGTLTLSGASTNTSLDVNAGTLVFNGTQTGGTTTINSSGTLQGIGTLANLMNYGTVTPGNSIGTLNVTGNYSNAAGSTLQVEIVPAGQCDRVHVTGTARLTGGTVDVHGVTGTYTDGQTYTFLTTDGGVTGTFAAVTDDLAFFDTALVYGAKTVQLRLTRSSNYVDVATTGNQYGVGRYLDSHRIGAAGDFDIVLSELNTLNAPGARQAFDAMSGELFGSLSTVSLETNERFVQGIAQRLRARSITRRLGFANANERLDDAIRLVCDEGASSTASSGWTPWFEGVGVGASLASDGNASGLNYSIGGITIGLERQLADDLLFGFVGGYTNTYTALDDRFDRGSVDTGSMGVYLHHDYETRYLTALAGYGYNGYNTLRHVTVGSIRRTAEASYGGNNLSCYAEVGRNLPGRFVHLQPYAALEYLRVDQNHFVESGADSLNLSVSGLEDNAFRGLLGTRVVSYFSTEAGCLVTLEGRAAWRHEFLSEERTLDATLAGDSGTPFAVAGVNVDRDAALLGSGVTWGLNTRLRLSLNYDLLFSHAYAVHAGSGSIEYAW